MKKTKLTLANSRFTDWIKFKQLLDDSVDLTISLKNKIKHRRCNKFIYQPDYKCTSPLNGKFSRTVIYPDFVLKRVVIKKDNCVNVG